MIYLAIIFVIVIFACIVRFDKKNQIRSNKLFIFVAFLLLGLLCVLRSSSVGRDTSAYLAAYQKTQLVPFSNFDYIYFEKGYVLLMKICCALKMNFQLFLVVCYLIMLIPIAVFIYKNSNNLLSSVLVFICYTYFEFYLTGIRQALSISLFLIGLLFLMREGKIIFRLFAYYVFLFIAFFFHRSAAICVVVPIFMLFKNTSRFTIGLTTLTVLFIAFRPFIFPFVKDVFDKGTMDTTSNIYIGMNVIVLTLIAILLLFYVRKLSSSALCRNISKNNNFLKYGYFLINIFVFSIAVAVFFGTDISARAYMYPNIVIVVLLYRPINLFEKRNKDLLMLIIDICLICYFAYGIFSSNNFDINPYYFFWE